MSGEPTAHVLEELIAERKLLCPVSGMPLELHDGRVRSPLGRDYGTLPGPIDFLDRRSAARAAAVEPGDVARLRAQLELPATEEVDRVIAAAIAATHDRYEQAHLTAEARILADRFRMPAFALRSRGLAGPLKRVVAAIGDRLGSARLALVSQSIGGRLSAGDAVWRSVRVRNTGAACLRTDPSRILMEFTGADGQPVPGTRVETELPVDVEPGREITLIVRIHVPGAPGVYTLKGCLLEKGVARAPFLEIRVEAIEGKLPVFEFAHYPTVLEYPSDHHVAMLEAAEFLDAHYGERRARILEIGGGMHPTGHSLALRGHRVVSADVSHSESILGALYYRYKMPQLGASLAFISCDASRLPFAAGAFDAVAMFAAFHHFADPPALLADISRVVADDGCVLIGCETCDPNPFDPQYRAELRNGINEQMFTVAEFAAFFRDAGLRVARARVDGPSLKVALLKERPGGSG